MPAWWYAAPVLFVYLLLFGYVLFGALHRLLRPEWYVRAEQSCRAKELARHNQPAPVFSPQESSRGGRRIRWLGAVRLAVLVAILWAAGVSVGWRRNAPITIGQGHQAPERSLIEAEALRFLQAGNASGITIAAVSGTNRLLLAFGRAGLSRSAVSADTLFEIGSITKVFTGIALAREIEAGSLCIDQPVETLLPKGAELPPGGEDITLGDLTSHASGLPRIPPNMSALGGLNMAFLGGDPYANYSVPQFLAGLRSAKLKFEPGEKSEYSNFGTGLLGWIMAQRAGTTYEEYIRRQVCEPLGMGDTGIEFSHAAARDRFAQGYRWIRQLGPLTIALRSAPWMLKDVFAGAGGLRSNGKDMLRFLEANMQPENTPIAWALETSHEKRIREGALTWVGMNWIRTKYSWSKEPVVWHNGGTGGFRSYLGFTANGEVGVVVLSNSAESVDGIGTRLLRKLAERRPAG